MEKQEEQKQTETSSNEEKNSSKKVHVTLGSEMSLWDWLKTLPKGGRTRIIDRRKGIVYYDSSQDQTK